MADNFEKLVALTVLEKNGTDSYRLKDTQYPAIMNQINNLRYTDAYGSALAPVDASAGTTTYTKNVAGTLQTKTAVSGANTRAEMKLNPVTISLKHNVYISEALSKIDINRGLQQATAQKMALFIAQLELDNQEKAFTMIKADTTSAVAVDYNQADMTGKAEAFRNFLVATATAKLRHKDANQGILRVRKDQILIDLAPEVFAYAIEGAVTGDLASQIVEEGIFSFVKLGGFKVRSNPYLDAGKAVGDMVAIITTDYAFKSPISMTAVNVDRLLPTNDMAVYVEANYGEGFVYDGVMQKIILK